jgi:dCMP deaminase
MNGLPEQVMHDGPEGEDGPWADGYGERAGLTPPVFPNKMAGLEVLLQRRLDWDQYFILQAMLAAAKSKDDSTWVGVTLVRDRSIIATGFNGFPRGVSETLKDHCRQGFTVPADKHPDTLIDERWNKRPEKYRWVEHAERNAIYQAAREGHSTNGTTMYFNTAGVPCSDCMRACIQAGVVEFVSRDIGEFKGVGQGTHYHCGDIEQQMMHEAGIRWRRVQDFAPDYRYTVPR